MVRLCSKSSSYLGSKCIRLLDTALSYEIFLKVYCKIFKKGVNRECVCVWGGGKGVAGSGCMGGNALPSEKCPFLSILNFPLKL